jgi:UDP-N-acetylglucosamine pyrophosphorylase
MEQNELDRIIETKMVSAGVGRPTIQSFLQALHKVAAGDRGMVPESSIEPVESLPKLDQLGAPADNGDAVLRQLAVIKLNGGLGTSMGLEKPKSLITVKGQDNFLDFIARQILHLRGDSSRPAFYLMDSFTTQRETLEYLRKYPALGRNGPLDFLQNKVPKVDARTLEPVSWPKQPELEWCPPGHGDIYPSLVSSGLLDQLLGQGIIYAFVSNSDNLGATVDVSLLRYFAQSGWSFLMEVAERTAADKKGGHLARNRQNGRLLFRESAQCSKEDEAQFQDTERHRFFNTNNLWIRLDHLRTELEGQGGALPLPLITNTKTVDPKDPASLKVLQLESAMGAAIQCFDRTGAVVVPRTRFAPVKTTSDLLALRSDACRVTEDARLILDESRHGQPPVIDLDSKHYKVLSEFERHLPNGAPSLRGCDSFRVLGSVQFDAGVVCEGTVAFRNDGGDVKVVRAGVYRDREVRL